MALTTVSYLHAHQTKKKHFLLFPSCYWIIKFSPTCTPHTPIYVKRLYRHVCFFPLHFYFQWNENSNMRVYCVQQAMLCVHYTHKEILNHLKLWIPQFCFIIFYARCKRFFSVFFSVHKCLDGPAATGARYCTLHVRVLLGYGFVWVRSPCCVRLFTGARSPITVSSRHNNKQWNCICVCASLCRKGIELFHLNAVGTWK